MPTRERVRETGIHLFAQYLFIESFPCPGQGHGHKQQDPGMWVSCCFCDKLSQQHKHIHLLLYCCIGQKCRGRVLCFGSHKAKGKVSVRLNLIWGEIDSYAHQVIGKIPLSTVIALRSFLLCWLSAGSLLAPKGHLHSLSLCPLHLQTSKGITNPSNASNFSASPSGPSVLLPGGGSSRL